MKYIVDTLKALADSNRIKILALLEKRPLCVCELKYALNISQPTTSAHLKILQGAKLITFKKSGLWVIYQLSKPMNSGIQNILKGLFLQASKEKEINHLIKKLSKIDRFKICQSKREQY